MPTRVSFSKLFTYNVEDSSKHLPLSELTEDCGHVHGLLELEISGRILPHMGFFGPEDVCFNTWVEELLRIVQTLGDSEVSEYMFDEGEQGQPAFTFRRQGKLLEVSVVDSPLSGAAGDASYQNVVCTWPEFRSAVIAFFSRFQAALLRECPLPAEKWWAARAAI